MRLSSDPPPPSTSSSTSPHPYDVRRQNRIGKAEVASGKLHDIMIFNTAVLIWLIERSLLLLSGVN